MMKKTLFFALFLMLFIIGAKAQSITTMFYENIQDTTILDNGDSLIIYYPPNYSTFIMIDDTTSDYVVPYDSKYYNLWKGQTPYFDNQGNVLWLRLEGCLACRNNYYPEGFAQPFHLDDTIAIVGVAAKIGGGMCNSSENGPSVDESSRFRLYDTNFNEIDFVGYHFRVLDPETGYLTDNTTLYNPYLNKHGYLFRTAHYLKDFLIVADEYYKPSQYHTANYGFNRSISIFDTIWQDTLIGSQEPYSPYLKKDGEWRRFADDTVYQFIQKTFIEFLPITYHPHQVSSLEEIFDESSSIYPNPAKEEITIESPYEIERIEINNVQGITQKTITTKGNRVIVPISDLEKGTYLVSIRTSEGNHTKKIVKE